MPSKSYIGRFAPSPTGPLHYGTMIAAIASFLQARANQGQWLVRIEDLDTTRSIKGADTKILKTLEAFGLHWDGTVLYQSQRSDAYEHALALLKQKHLVYPCTCSRKQQAEEAGKSTPIYNGKCKRATHWPEQDYAVRLKVLDENVYFTDRVYAAQQQNIAQQVGDFVIKRRDGLFAYQLAVVVDDAAQEVTEVVRGADLLDSTPRQRYLQNCLGYRQPSYFHLPLALDTSGSKLGKSDGAAAIDDSRPLASIISILKFLGQDTTSLPVDSSLETFWREAIRHWNPDLIPKTNRVGHAHPGG